MSSHLQHKRILSEVETECQCQEAMYPSSVDDKHTYGEWAQIFLYHLGLAFGNAGEVNAERFRRQMIRLGALVVSCAASRDRVEGRDTTIAPELPRSKL